jgi:hypothetical protein
VPVIVFLPAALIFGEAQQKNDVRFLRPGSPGWFRRFTALGMWASEANDAVIPIARLTRLETHVWTSVLHHAYRRSTDRRSLQSIASNHFVDFREVKNNPSRIGRLRVDTASLFDKQIQACWRRVLLFELRTAREPDFAEADMARKTLGLQRDSGNWSPRATYPSLRLRRDGAAVTMIRRREDGPAYVHCGRIARGRLPSGTDCGASQKKG